MNHDVGSITLDQVYDSLLRTSHLRKKTTVKLHGKSSDLNQLWSCHHPMMMKAKQSKYFSEFFQQNVYQSRSLFIQGFMLLQTSFRGETLSKILIKLLLKTFQAVPSVSLQISWVMVSIATSTVSRSSYGGWKGKVKLVCFSLK